MARWPRAASLLRSLRDPGASEPAATEPVDPRASERDTGDSAGTFPDEAGAAAPVTVGDVVPDPAGGDVLRPDPSKIIPADVPFVRLPTPATLFAQRASRFQALAADHPLADYLMFLAALARLQHGMQAALPALSFPAGPTPAETRLRLEHAMPPLSAADLASDGFGATLDRLLQGVTQLGAKTALPDAASQAASTLGALSEPERLELATSVFTGSYPADRLGECLFVAAALQVHLSRRAALLDANALKPVADGVCPACGSAPVASLIVGWTRAGKARYCACPLCATQWNHVRIKCTSCGSTASIKYHGIKDLSENVAVETCDACHSYIKHMQQHADESLDPVADDIASCALDLLIHEEGYRRGGLNPLFVQA